METLTPNLLYFSAQLPSAKIPIAGQKVAWNHLKELSLKNKIILISFINEQESTYFSPGDYDFCLEKKFFRISRIQKFKNHLKNLNYPSKVTGRYQNRIFNKMLELIKKFHIKKVFFEFTSSLLYANKLKQLHPDIEVEFVEHDVTFQSFKRLSFSHNILRKLMYSIEYVRMRNFEIKALSLFETVSTLNEKDRKILNEHGIKKVNVYYPKVEDWIINTRRETIEPYSIMFLGAMHRKENNLAVLWFCQKIFPAIQEDFPEAKFYIIGGGITQKIKDLSINNENIIVTGFVDDLKPFFEKIQVAVVPLHYGAGIKIKTLETISAGIPTVATEIGAEGIEPNPNLFIAKTKRKFIEIISEQLLLDH